MFENTARSLELLDTTLSAFDKEIRAFALTLLARHFDGCGCDDCETARSALSLD